jgi:hypothetical protein
MEIFKHIKTFKRRVTFILTEILLGDQAFRYEIKIHISETASVSIILSGKISITIIIIYFRIAS